MRPDIVVMTDVIGQLAGLDEPFATAVTHIRFFSGMLAYVSNERTGLCKASSANQTQTGLFTCVDSHMSL